MNLLKKILAVTLLGSLVGTEAVRAVPASAAAAEDGYYHGEMDNRVIWTPGSDDGKYRNHRIPGVVVTKQDTVIIYCEARTGDTTYSLRDNGDWCLMDIYIQRSTDGGETFGDPIYIAKGNRETACVNNPSIIVGNDNTLHFLYCKNYSIQGGGIWYRQSTDDGLTWTEETEISRFAESVPHGNFAFGPGHGVCTEDGTLLNPVWLNPATGGPAKTYVFYSRDNGKTWAMSDAAAQNSGETAIALLSDGSVLLNTRSHPYRQITTSPDGISGWSTTYQDLQLPDPSCSGGLVSVNLPGLPCAQLFVNCASGEKEDRTKVTLRCSFDDCRTYEKSLLLSGYTGGYSDVAVDSRGKGYVLYEVSFGKRVHLVRFSFYDEFIKGNSKFLSAETAFRFDGERTLDYVEKLTHLESRLEQGALALRATDTRKHSVLLNFSSVTRNLNLSDYEAVVFRLRVHSSEERDFVLGTSFLSGRVFGEGDGIYHRLTVPADGGWHTVVMDLTEIKAKGMLRGIRLELFGDTLKCEVGDGMDLEWIQFYPSLEQANQFLKGQEAETSAQPSQTDESNGSKGCKSALSSIPLIAAAVSAAVVAAVVLYRKKRLL